MKNFFLMIVMFPLLYSCGDVGKALRNEKIKTTDECLVKKKGPLVLPPNFEKIPEPNTILKKEVNQKDKIRNILKAPKKKNTINKSSSSIEKSILEKIR